MIENLHIALGNNLPSSKERQILLQSWRNLISLAMQLVRFPIYKDKYLSMLTLHNQNTLHGSLAKGKGVILLAPHTGNFFLSAAYIAQRYPVSVMVRPSRNKSIQDFVQQSFDRMGFATINRVGGLYQAMRALKRNQIVIFAIDQHAGESGAWVDFFNKKASTFTSPALLAQKTGAAVHIGHTHRYPDGKNEAWVTNPLSIQTTNDPQKDLVANTQMFTNHIENIIRAYPETWMWMHRRWKEPPKSKYISGISASN